MSGGRVDLVAGNTRLRGRLPALLRGDRLAVLRSPDDVAAALRAGTAVPPGSVGGAARPALLALIGRRRTELLRAAVAAYDGAARELVGALVSDDERADLVTLLRGAATATPHDEVLAAVHGTGRLDLATVRELVADEPEAVVARLVTRRLPDPATARAVAAAWQRFALHGDVAELEQGVARAHVEGVAARLARFGRVAEPVRTHLARLRDAANLVTAVRLRHGADARAGDLLPPGAVPVRALQAVAAGADVVAAAPAPWRAAVARTLPLGVEPLARALDEVVDAAAQHARWRADPLGAGVPVAYVSTVVAEARALRRAVLVRPVPSEVAA